MLSFSLLLLNHKCAENFENELDKIVERTIITTTPPNLSLTIVFDEEQKMVSDTDEEIGVREPQDKKLLKVPVIDVKPKASFTRLTIDDPNSSVSKTSETEGEDEIQENPSREKADKTVTISSDCNALLTQSSEPLTVESCSGKTSSGKQSVTFSVDTAFNDGENEKEPGTRSELVCGYCLIAAAAENLKLFYEKMTKLQSQFFVFEESVHSPEAMSTLSSDIKSTKSFYSGNIRNSFFKIPGLTDEEFDQFTVLGKHIDLIQEIDNSLDLSCEETHDYLKETSVDACQGILQTISLLRSGRFGITEEKSAQIIETSESSDQNGYAVPYPSGEAISDDNPKNVQEASAEVLKEENKQVEDSLKDSVVLESLSGTSVSELKQNVEKELKKINKNQSEYKNYEDLINALSIYENQVKMVEDEKYKTADRIFLMQQKFNIRKAAPVFNYSASMKILGKHANVLKANVEKLKEFLEEKTS